MALNEKRKKEIKKYLLKNTTYKEQDIEKIPEKSLEATYTRIKECLETYPRKIIEYYENNPTIVRKYTDEEIYRMNYNELDNLMNELGLKKFRKKKQGAGNTGAQIATETVTYVQMSLDFGAIGTKEEQKNTIQPPMPPTTITERDFEYVTS